MQQIAIAQLGSSKLTRLWLKYLGGYYYTPRVIITPLQEYREGKNVNSKQRKCQ